MFQAQNRETTDSTLKVVVSFKIIMTTSTTRLCFTKQHQNCKTKTKTAVCKTKTKTGFLVSDRSYPKTDSFRPHHCQRLSTLRHQHIDVHSRYEICS